MPQRIEFAKLLSPRELTHLVLGHRKPGACFVFCLVIATIWLVFTAWLWLPDPLRPSEVTGHGNGFGLDCANLPGDDNSYDECTLTDELLGNYRKTFASEPRFEVNFDTPPQDSSEAALSAFADIGPYDGAHVERASLLLSAAASFEAPAEKVVPKPSRKKNKPASPARAASKPPTDPTAYLKNHVCNVERSFAMAKLDHSQVRFIYLLLARNDGQTCADRQLGAASRLVRTLGFQGNGITAGGWFSVLLDGLLLALCTAVIVLVLLTRRAYLWLYGSYHVRRQK